MSISVVPRGGVRLGYLIAAIVVVVVLKKVADEWARPGAEPKLDERPNILWIVSEDTGPHLGAYGDHAASTPHLDALARRGYRYAVAWSNGPVCAAARSALITGVYAESTGGEHMRSLVRLPDFMRMYPALLRDLGYYTANHSKTDYNFAETETIWDDSSSTAHWKNRKPGQPFFAIFNLAHTHEAFIRQRPLEPASKPDETRVPPYMPDIQEFRDDWSQYAARISVMDGVAGKLLAELADAGLDDDTIVMYFGDHGAGMPRNKRFAYNSGLHVPLIVYIPPRFHALRTADVPAAGGVSERLVSFVDLPPTLLSLAGSRPPAWMQGRAFLGAYAMPPPSYVFGFRGRMDERYDLVRSVRDRRYIYIRNFMPHRPNGQHVAYMFATPGVSTWKEMFENERLPAAQAAFWLPRPMEELYDLEADPAEISNLAELPEYRDLRDRLRNALFTHARAIRDVGFLPEYELHAEGQRSPYERAHDPAAYDFDAIFAAALRASDPAVTLERVRGFLADPNPNVRYWAATGVLIRGKDAVEQVLPDLRKLLADPAPGPRITAAEAMARFGRAADRQASLEQLLRDADASRVGEYVALLALYSLNQVPDLPRHVVDRVEQLPQTIGDPRNDERTREDYLSLLKSAIEHDVR